MPRASRRVPGGASSGAGTGGGMSASPSLEQHGQHSAVELVRRIASGDPVAERDFVARFQPGVRTLVRRHSRPADPAIDDLVQDVLESVLRALRAGSVLDEGALPGYVRGTVVYTVQAHYRKRARRGEDRTDGDPADLVEEGDPASKAHADALVGTVRSLLDELGVPRDREILRRFYLQEQDRDEICTALGIETSHFHRVLFRARGRLRELLVRAGLENAG